MKAGDAVQTMIDNYPKQLRRASRGMCWGGSLLFDVLDDAVLLLITPFRMLLLTARDMCIDFAPEPESDKMADEVPVVHASKEQV